MDWVSWVALALLVAILVAGWVRGASALLTLVVAMAALFLIGLVTGSRISIGGSPLLDDLAWRPVYLHLEYWPYWFTLATTMFLHADVLHLVMNVVIFIIMGMGLEERVGRGRFLLLFAVAGVVGTLLHSLYIMVLQPFGVFVPVVGASGAVFGIMGAYATLYPRDKVFLFLFLIIPNVPVYIAAGVYTMIEMLALIGPLGSPGVAHHAHVGGLIGGVFLALLLQRVAPVRTRLERMARPHEVDEAAVEALVATDEQRRLLAKLRANRDEPELAGAWLERLARATPCPRCGEVLTARGGRLRCGCGYQVPVLGQPSGAGRRTREG